METFVADASGWRFSDSVFPAALTCTFDSDERGICVEKVFDGSGATTQTYPGSVVPFYTLEGLITPVPSTRTALGPTTARKYRPTMTPSCSSTHFGVAFLVLGALVHLLNPLTIAFEGIFTAFRRSGGAREQGPAELRHMTELCRAMAAESAEGLGTAPSYGDVTPTRCAAAPTQ
ncbi:hypothetical protein B0H11DRAFT_2331772 [Mycena galericulata]|nr:hypothetical protein B0H11DRAFT_2331772 [Mycena galericulata]